MKKSFTTTLILLVVFVGLILWNQFYENKIRPDKTEADEKSKQLVTLSREEIHELTIERLKNPPKDSAEEKATAATPKTVNTPEFETFQLKKTGQDWSLTQPIQDKADASTVTTIVSTLTTTKQERVVEEKPKDLEVYGLKIPWIKVTLKKDSAAKPEVLLLGKDTPTGASCYAKLGGTETVYRVPKSLRTNLDKDTKAVRNKDILGLPKADIAEVEIQNPKENMVLKKDDKENWILARDQLPAENNEWTKTFNALIDMKATNFSSEEATDLAVYGLQKPEAKVWFKNSKSQARLGVWLGRVKEKDKEHFFAKREDRPTIFEIDKEPLTKALLPSVTYQDYRLADFSRFDVSRLKLERKNGSIELLKEEKGWTLPANPKIKIDTAKVDSFLAGLQDARIVKYLPQGQKSGIQEPELTVRLYEKKNNKENEKVWIKFGNRKQKDLYADRSDNTAFLIRPDDFTKLNANQKDFEQTEEKKEEKQEAQKNAKPSHS